MREIQAYGRYALYAVLWIALFQAFKETPPMQWVLVLGVVLGVPGYWLWTRARHKRDHLDDPRDSCSHCRDEFTVARLDDARRERETAMRERAASHRFARRFDQD